jgi:hypothetical protein
MKKRYVLLLILFAVFLSVCFAGCRGVILSAEYSQILDETAALSARTAEMAEAGQLSEDNMVKALKRQAEIWQEFQKARDGQE